MLSRRRNSPRAVRPSRDEEEAGAPASRGKPAATSPPATKGTTAFDELTATSDDLTAKMRAWAHNVQAVYGSSPPVAQVKVTVLALTGVDVGAPFWVAAAAGAFEETGPAVPLAEAMPSGWPPKGAPSWIEEPIELPLRDVTADLVLLLCESEGTDATRACVGRVVIPLSSLLPLSPFGGQPAPRQLWAEVFPPAPAYAAGQVHTLLAPAATGLPRTGMHQPAAGQQGRVLVRLDLTLESSLLSAYLFSPPFDATAPHPEPSSRAVRQPLAPERVLLAAARLRRLVADVATPAAFRLARTRPWSMGGVLLCLAYTLCFHVSLPALPLWLLALYVVNAAAIQLLGLTTAFEPWEGGSGGASGLPSEHPAHVAAGGGGSKRLGGALGGGVDAETHARELEAAVLPLLTSLEAAMSFVERLSAVPISGDPRVSLLAAAPMLLTLFGLWLVLFAWSPCPPP